MQLCETYAKHDIQVQETERHGSLKKKKKYKLNILSIPYI